MAAITYFDRARLFEIIKQRSFRSGEFTLASGKKSNMYFNLKPTMMDPEGAALIAYAFIELMAAKLETPPYCISGLEMGAVPFIGAIAAVSAVKGKSVKTTFVRKQTKGYGTNQRIEGLTEGELSSFAGKTVFVIDDVSTSGGSIMQAADAVKDAGAVVTDVACLVNRHEGGDELFETAGIRLHSVFSAQEFLGN